MSVPTKTMLIAAFMAFVGIATIAANEGLAWGRIVVVFLAFALVAGLIVALRLMATDSGDDEGGA